MTPSLSEIIYCSRGRAPFGGPFDPGFAEILAVARRNNERLGITGALMYNSGYFIQLLEGPAATVDRVFDSIQTDTRHHEIVLVSRRPIEDRHFPDWAMGFAATPAEPATAAILARAVAAPDDTVADNLRTLLQRSTATAAVWGTNIPAGEVA